jgi:hypothetical protein
MHHIFMSCVEPNAPKISGFPEHFILTCPVHIELNVQEIPGCPGHVTFACLVHI